GDWNTSLLLRSSRHVNGPAWRWPVTGGSGPPDLLVEARGRARGLDPPFLDPHPLGPEPLALLVVLRRPRGEGDAPIAAQHPVPWQRRVIVVRQHAGRQPGTARQTGPPRNLAVGGHFAGRDRAHRREDPLAGVRVHG